MRLPWLESTERIREVTGRTSLQQRVHTTYTSRDAICTAASAVEHVFMCLAARCVYTAASPELSLVPTRALPPLARPNEANVFFLSYSYTTISARVRRNKRAFKDRGALFLSRLQQATPFSYQRPAAAASWRLFPSLSSTSLSCKLAAALVPVPAGIDSRRGRSPPPQPAASAGSLPLLRLWPERRCTLLLALSLCTRPFRRACIYLYTYAHTHTHRSKGANFASIAIYKPPTERGGCIYSRDRPE